MRPLTEPTEEAPDMADLQDVLNQRVQDLPVLPGVLVRLLALDPGAETYFDDVRDLVETDPAFAARVLVAANAASSAPRDPITSVGAAVTRLGSSGTADIVMALSFATVFVPRDAWEKSLWRHSIQVAVATRAVVAADREQRVDKATAYTAGLLHDIGRFVMFHVADDQLRMVDEGDWDSPAALVDAERTICGVPHTELGALACRGWGLPDAVADVVEHHHDHLIPAAGTVDPLLEAIQFADLAMFPSARPDTASWLEGPPEVFDHEVLARAPRHLQDGTELRMLLSDVERYADDLCVGLGLD